MQRLISPAILFATVLSVGCSFTPGQTNLGAGAGTSGTGAGSIAGNSGGSSVGLTGGDVVVTGTGGSTDCGQNSVAITTLPPDILIVQDKSLSMVDNAAGAACNAPGCSKWDQVSAAVENVVMNTQASVNWGLKFFGNGTGNSNAALCQVTAGANVGVATMNYTPILNAFTATQPSTATPTNAAMTSAAAYLTTLTDPNPKFILLATDGLPNCQPGNNNIMADDSMGAVTAVSNAAGMSFNTFVVGIATDADQMATATLNMMAAAGNEPQTGAATQYYSITDTTSLETALNKIVGIAASCTLPLTGAPPNLTNVAISVDTGSGTIAVGQDATNGWSYINNNTAVQFNGTSCDNLKNGTYTNVQFVYACAGHMIIIG